MFCFLLFDYAGERNYNESGEKKVRERESGKGVEEC